MKEVLLEKIKDYLTKEHDQLRWANVHELQKLGTMSKEFPGVDICRLKTDQGLFSDLEVRFKENVKENEFIYSVQIPPETNTKEFEKLIENTIGISSSKAGYPKIWNMNGKFICSIRLEDNLYSFGV